MWHDMTSKLIAALLGLPTYFDRHRRRNMYKTNFTFCDAAAGIATCPSPSDDVRWRANDVKILNYTGNTTLHYNFKVKLFLNVALQVCLKMTPATTRRGIFKTWSLF